MLAVVPPEADWFANIDNEGTKRNYKTSLSEFMRFVGITKPAEFRTITRAHVIAGRKPLKERDLTGTTIRGNIAALSSLFSLLSSLFEQPCESNAVTHNPVKGVKRPKVQTYEGKTLALGDHHSHRMAFYRMIGSYAAKAKIAGLERSTRMQCARRLRPKHSISVQSGVLARALWGARLLDLRGAS